MDKHTSIYVKIIIFLSISSITKSQSSLIKQWDYRFGGTANEYLYSLCKSNDGGYLLGGPSVSNLSGNKSQNSWGGFDYWIVKTNFSGIKQWDKAYGGTNMDYLFSAEQTFDGGYILGGYSQSGISGNKTEVMFGVNDYWMVRIDALGNKLWDKDFGGTAADKLTCIQQTMDGGYILGGYSYSDAGGNKSASSFGGVDYWIVKTDSLGIKEWDKEYGGNDEEMLLQLKQTFDGGYILGGYSKSGISGNKTEPNWGDEDYWIIKVDAFGNIQWQKDFGGVELDHLCAIQQTFDSGYILGGYSYSDSSGNKTQPTKGLDDYWIVKIDTNGNILWQRDFGGNDADEDVGSIVQTSEGGYLIAGTSLSAISGDKTEANLGNEQTWVVRTDSLGNKLWDKTLRTDNALDDEIGFAIEANYGCYIMGNYTDATIGGDKSQTSWSLTYDYWFIKFCDSTITTFNYAALNNDGVRVIPNPANNYLEIELADIISNGALEIFDLCNKKLFKKKIPNATSIVHLNVQFLKNGIYYFRLYDGKNTFNKKLVINHN